MSIKVRLIIMNFLQFFVWGSWLISLGGYMGRELHFEGGQIGAIFATMGIASLVMPGSLSFLRFHRYGIRPDVLGHVTQSIGIYAYFVISQYRFIQCIGAI